MRVALLPAAAALTCDSRRRLRAVGTALQLLKCRAILQRG
eukprot:COSAG05_NODE_14492_length_395_cov_0.858108_2_plen_39_part_01